MMPRPAPEALRRQHAGGQRSTRTIAQCIAEQVALRGDKLAIQSGERASSYAELDAQAARLAGFFGPQGMGRGDVITLHLPKRCVAAALGLDHRDRCFLASPVTHASGFMHGLVLNLTSGATLSLLDVFSGEAAVRIMAEDGATWTMGASVFLGDTLATLARQQVRLPALRYFMCGGAPIAEELVRRALALGLRVLPVHGSTESPPHALVPPEAPLQAPGQTDGKPLPGIEVREVEESTAPRPTATPPATRRACAPSAAWPRSSCACAAARSPSSASSRVPPAAPAWPSRWPATCASPPKAPESTSR